MTKCKYSDKYKAIKKPRCGCETCLKKWENKNKLNSMK